LETPAGQWVNLMTAVVTSDIDHDISAYLKHENIKDLLNIMLLFLGLIATFAM
jgi:hypothetical protein